MTLINFFKIIVQLYYVQKIFLTNFHLDIQLRSSKSDKEKNVTTI